MSDKWLPFKRKYFGHDKELFEKVSRLNAKANSGEISYEDFLSEMSKITGISPDKIRSITESSSTGVNEELLDYIKSLKPEYKIGMLSNTSRNMLKELFETNEINLFDEVVLSYEEGMVKPDQRAYKLIAQKLGVDTNQCVFIDDQERHCVGARQTGMQAIAYQDFPQMKQDLEALLS